MLLYGVLSDNTVDIHVSVNVFVVDVSSVVIQVIHFEMKLTELNVCVCMCVITAKDPARQVLVTSASGTQS